MIIPFVESHTLLSLALASELCSEVLQSGSDTAINLVVAHADTQAAHKLWDDLHGDVVGALIGSLKQSLNVLNLRIP
jgi:hypothetical protein